MNRNIVVTGAGTGIGRAIAARFLREGDHVTITGRREGVLAEAAAQLGGNVHYAAFDATDPEAITAVLSRLPERIDVLVNAAGGNTGFQMPAETLADIRRAWISNLEANLLSAVLVTTALKERLPEGGRIVSIGSQTARSGGDSYGAAKAGLESWTASLAFQLGARGITVNVVAPGLTDDTEFYPFALPDTVRTRLLDSSANGRAARPDDVAAAVVFVASEDAGHLTGQVIPINGGAQLAR